MVKYFLATILLVFTTNIFAMGGAQLSEEELAIRKQVIELKLQLKTIEDSIRKSKRTAKNAKAKAAAARSRLSKPAPITTRSSSAPPMYSSSPSTTSNIKAPSIDESIKSAITHQNSQPKRKSVEPQQEIQQTSEPWVEPSYRQSVARAQNRVNSERNTNCKEKLNYYFKALVSNPDSIFLQTKFEEWHDLCGEHLKR